MCKTQTSARTTLEAYQDNVRRIMSHAKWPWPEHVLLDDAKASTGSTRVVTRRGAPLWLFKPAAFARRLGRLGRAALCRCVADNAGLAPGVGASWRGPPYCVRVAQVWVLFAAAR